MQPTLVTVEFLPIGEIESELILTHERFSRKEPADRYRGGWDQIVARLERTLQARRRL